jgi:DnaJ family protein B protein 12
MSVANADEARKALKLAQDYREKGSYSVALKWARKSSSLSPSSEATSLTASLEKEIASGATSTSIPSKDAASSATKATGAETHPSASGTHQRPGHGSSSAGGTSTKDSGDAKSRSFTPEQTKVVKRVIACKAHEYYSILAGELDIHSLLVWTFSNTPLIPIVFEICSGKELFRGGSAESISKGQSDWSVTRLKAY